MKVKLLITATLVLIIVGIITTTSQSQKQFNQQLLELEEKEKLGTIKLKERVRLAKAKGQTRIQGSGMVSLYPVARTPEELNQLLDKYTIVVAQPIAEKGYVDNSENIRSWQKFKILEMLSQALPLPSFVSLTVPEELSPIKDDEFVIHREGGRVTIDGVEVTGSEENIPELKKSRKYLLLLSLNPSTRVAQLVLGPQSILPVKSNDILDPQSGHILGYVLETFHGNSLSKLKVNLKERSTHKLP